MEKIRKQIIETIKRSNSVLIMPSAPVDGDSLGSALALYWVLKKIGKEVTVVCADPIPDTFEFLPTTSLIRNEFMADRDFIVALDMKKSAIKTIHTKMEHDKVNVVFTPSKGQFKPEDVSFHYGPSRYDLIITVDTADLQQLGRFYDDNTDLFTKIPLINIDHHASNGNFGRINYVDMMCSATTEILFPLIQDMEKEFGMELMDSDTATLLLAGIITDTGSYQNANTTPRSFSVSAQLIKHGARQQEIIQHIFKTKQLSTLRLWGRILTNMKTDPKYHFAWSTISRKDLDETGSREDETGGIIDELMTNAPGTEIVFLLKEKAEGLISGSIRTTTASADASLIAETFGGGGHVQASGFKVKSKDLYSVEKQMIERVKAYQKERLGIPDEEEDGVDRATPVKARIEINKAVLSEGEGKYLDKKLLTGGAVEKAVEKETYVEADAADKSDVSRESFTDMIIKSGLKGDEEEGVEMEEGVTYRFEV